MGDDYIRRRDAITAACKGFCHPGVRCPDEPCKEQTKYLRELPPADVTPVKHSRWIETEDGVECENCGREAVYQIVGNHWEYEPWCPHCGAKMNAQQEGGVKT